MKLTAKQRKQIQDKQDLVLMEGRIEISWGKVDANDHVEKCNYKFDGYECSRVGVKVDGEVEVVSNTWKKVETYLTEEWGL